MLNYSLPPVLFFLETTMDLDYSVSHIIVLSWQSLALLDTKMGSDTIFSFLGSPQPLDELAYLPTSQ